MAQTQEKHEHRTVRCDRLFVCQICGEPLSHDPDGVLTPLHPLEFESLSDDLISKITNAAKLRGSIDAIPRYARTFAQLWEACDLWSSKHPGAVVVLRLPPGGEYIARMVTDVKHILAGDCAVSRDFLDFLDQATKGWTTLSQLRLFLQEHSSKLHFVSDKGTH